MKNLAGKINFGTFSTLLLSDFFNFGERVQVEVEKKGE